jgi:lipopolysaccharide transport system permease protein
MVVREFQGRYMGSLLGSLWTVLQPAAMIFIYTVVFSRIMQARLAGVDDTLAYGVFICAGLLPWNFFSDLLGRCQTVFIEHAGMLKKASFPRITLPLILLLSAAVHFLIAMAILFLFLALTGRFPGWAVLGLIPLIVIQQTAVLGLGIFLGTLNVFFRDVGQMVGIVLQFWFWFTPIVYPLTILPESIQVLVRANPMTPLVLTYQEIILFGRWPQWHLFTAHAVMAGCAIVLGFLFFLRVSSELTDEL